MGRVVPLRPQEDRIADLYRRDHARLWRSLYGFSGSRDVADEATAEAFAQALRRGDEIRDVGAWVWRSAFAIARGELQRRRRQPATTGRESADAVMPDHELAGMLAALGQLDERDRELIVLCHLGGWKPGELADLLDVAPGTMRVRLHRATQQARTLLEGSES